MVFVGFGNSYPVPEIGTSYGARPLRRAIQRHLLDPLALAILDGKFAEGATVHVSAAADGKTLTIS